MQRVLDELQVINAKLDKLYEIIGKTPDTTQLNHAGDLAVFTDGSCLDNGADDARAAYAVVWPSYTHLNYSAKLDGEVQTNNRAELTAVIHAIKQADAIDPPKQATLNVYTDSEIICKTVKSWISRWRTNGWKNSANKPVSNIDLVKELDALTQSRKCVFHHVKAHTNDDTWEAKNNALADEMARNCATGFQA